MPVLAHQYASHIIARQRGLELAQLVGVEFIDLDAVLATQVPRQAILLRAFGGTIDIEMAEPVEPGPQRRRRLRAGAMLRRAGRRAGATPVPGRGPSPACGPG